MFTVIDVCINLQIRSSAGGERAGDAKTGCADEKTNVPPSTDSANCSNRHVHRRRHQHVRLQPTRGVRHGAGRLGVSLQTRICPIAAHASLQKLVNVVIMHTSLCIHTTSCILETSCIPLKDHILYRIPGEKPRRIVLDENSIRGLVLKILI